MISTALEYAKRLRELNIPGDIVGQTGDIFKAVPQVKLDFESPAVSLSAKHNVYRDNRVMKAAVSLLT